MPTSATLPVEPIVRAVEQRGGPAAAARRQGADFSPGSRLMRAYHRAKARGSVTDAAADLLCIRLIGEHPVTVFGDLWLLAEHRDHATDVVDLVAQEVH